VTSIGNCGSHVCHGELRWIEWEGLVYTLSPRYYHLRWFSQLPLYQEFFIFCQRRLLRLPLFTYRSSWTCSTAGTWKFSYSRRPMVRGFGSVFYKVVVLVPATLITPALPYQSPAFPLHPGNHQPKILNNPPSITVQAPKSGR